jgi:hypothetical protein
MIQTVQDLVDFFDKTEGWLLVDSGTYPPTGRYWNFEHPVTGQIFSVAGDPMETVDPVVRNHALGEALKARLGLS